MPEDHNISRRELVVATLNAMVGGASLVLLSGCRNASSGLNAGSDTGPCPLNPEQEEGPFYVDEGLLRSDILDGQAGVPLQLTIKLLKAAKCEAVANAAVEIWSANSLGKYSDKAEQATVGQKYLRGVQISDASGVVQFKTIYPGWYSGRACHIHLKVRTGGQASGSSYAISGSSIVHSGQFFFPTDLNESLRSLYTGDSNEFINNANDRVYNSQKGARSLLTLTGSLQAGFAGAISVDVNA